VSAGYTTCTAPANDVPAPANEGGGRSEQIAAMVLRGVAVQQDAPCEKANFVKTGFFALPSFEGCNQALSRYMGPLDLYRVQPHHVTHGRPELASGIGTAQKDAEVYPGVMAAAKESAAKHAAMS
jgi:hypothetical protein